VRLLAGALAREACFPANVKDQHKAREWLNTDATGYRKKAKLYKS
jgi:hypothetical protein